VLTLLVRADGLLVVPAGVEAHHAGTEVSVELLRGLDEIARTVVAIGSHDLVFDLAASALRADAPLVHREQRLMVAPGALDSSQLVPPWTLLRSDCFQSAVYGLGGYSVKEMGRRIR
jgi:hypothetical protein